MSVLLRGFSYIPYTSFSKEVFFFTLLMLVLVRSFSYTSHAGRSEEFLLHFSR